MNIPTPEEVSKAYVSVTTAGEMLGVQVDTNIQHTLRKAGVQIVRLAGKPMCYRHEVEQVLARQEAHVH